MQKKINEVKTLLDALPYIKEFYGSKVVIKYGGSAQINPELKNRFAQDIVLLSLVGIKPIIVHGGGNKITQMLNRLNIKTEFKNGYRVTSKEAIEIAKMVLIGDINNEIVSNINHHGAKAIGLNGKDARIVLATAKNFDLYGYTGEIEKIDSGVIDNIIDQGLIPVIAPIAGAGDKDHPGFNINADLMAAKIAISLKAKKVLFLTDTVGVLDKDEKLIQSLNENSVKTLIDNGTITGGMLPKIESCLEAIQNGVTNAHIIDGRVEHSIILELFTSSGIGTIFKN
jgi:acetylglutamate kinase